MYYKMRNDEYTPVSCYHTGHAQVPPWGAGEKCAAPTSPHIRMVPTNARNQTRAIADMAESPDL